MADKDCIMESENEIASNLNGIDICKNVSKKQKMNSEENVKEIKTKNGLTKEEKNDQEYFSSYADLELHRTMIEDQVRTNAYRDAIMSNAELHFKDKVVADVGCGTGILSMFCAQAGAKKVYAIEASDIGLYAKKAIAANGFEDIITVLHGRAEEVELPEKVDVLVSEWMGYMLLYETMLPSVIHVRDKYLKPDGLMLPDRAVLYLAMGETRWIGSYEESSFDFWVSLQHVYGLDMCPLAEQAVNKYKNSVHVHSVAAEDIITESCPILDLNLSTVKAEDALVKDTIFNLTCQGSRTLNSAVMWFDVSFPGGHRFDLENAGLHIGSTGSDVEMGVNKGSNEKMSMNTEVVIGSKGSDVEMGVNQGSIKGSDKKIDLNKGSNLETSKISDKTPKGIEILKKLGVKSTLENTQNTLKPLCKRYLLSTSPYRPETHWQQVVIALPESHVGQDTLIKGTVAIKPHKDYFRHLSVSICDFEVGGKSIPNQAFTMDDNCIDAQI